MIHKLIFVYFLLLPLLTLVHSHIHSVKAFESTLTKCCEIGTKRAALYPTSLASVIKVASESDVCYVKPSENNEPLPDFPGVQIELRPQCSSVIQHCCVNELNKQTCRFSKSLVKERLDGTSYSLNKAKKNDSKSEQQPGYEEKYYKECMIKPVDLPSIDKTSNSTPTGKLFHRIVQYGGSQSIFSECCVACKLGLFSALNDYKCIIQRSLRPSKHFEETFYDCCFNLKRELNFSSGRMVDIPRLELLVYPELTKFLSSNIDLTNVYRPLINSPSIVQQETNFFKTHLEQKNAMIPDIGTESVFEELKARKLVTENDVEPVTTMKPLPNVTERFPLPLPDCPKGMRLDERNTNICVDDNCQRNQHRCKANQKCVNTNPGFKCEPKGRKLKPKPPKLPPKDTAESTEAHTPKPAPTEPKKSKPLQEPTVLNSSPSKKNQPIFPTHPFPQYQPPFNRPPGTSNYLPNPYQPPPNRFPPVNYPNPRSPNYPVRNNMLRVSKRKLIDKCAIGNHNCETQTQTCRRTENDFVCVNNQDLAQYDRMNPHNFEDNLLTTTTQPQGTAVFQCPLGFEFNADSGVCADINECETGAHNCSSDYRCDNKIGSFVCTREQSCGTGYTYNQDTKICEDINECRLNLHQCRPPYSCVNLIGSFRCELSRCKEGHRLLNNQCIPVTCQPGFRFNPLSERCVDQDECLNGIDPADLNFILLNRNDPYEKLDFSRHERLTNGRLAACRPDERCVNHLGGFFCESPIKRLNERLGEDDQLSRRHTKPVDAVRSAPKIGDCITEADYYATDKLQSLAPSTKVCGYRCVRSNDEWTCECPDGYSLKRDGLKCTPIDRCKLADTCQPNEVCVNLRGSHKCVDIQCPSGYTKNLKNPLQCVIVDKAAIYSNQPKYYSFSYLALQSNVSLGGDGEVRIASIRGATNLNVDYKLISANSSELVDQSNLARADDFQLKRAESDHIYVKRSLVGPQQVQLQFTYTTNQNDMKIIMNRLQLTIYVSKYAF